MMKLLDLFSGIGGFSLGLESTGYFKTIAFCEKDDFCQKVLRKHWKDIPIESEIRNVKGSNYKADIITGGFPCQPFSVAGKRKGTDDDRYLWDETIRVIRETKPRWFIGENVEGIINIQDGMVLRQVQNDLEAEGFQVRCLVIPASSIGAWHQRKRVWIVANSNSRLSIRENEEIQTGRNTSDSSSENVSNPKHNGSHRPKGNETFKSSNQSEERLSIRDDKDVSNTDSIRHGRWGSKRCANEEWLFFPREQERRKMGSETPRCDDIISNSDSKGLQGHRLSTDMETKQRQDFTERSIKEQQTWWQTQSRICGVPHGISFELDKSRKNRIKSLGNSIVPQIARQLGLAIMEAENDNN